MKWCEAYIQMKDNNAFVRRDCWGYKYFIWLKPAIDIRLEWCRDPQLKQVVEKYGHKTDDGSLMIKAKDCICLYNGHCVETGFVLRREDLVAEDWRVIKL